MPALNEERGRGKKRSRQLDKEMCSSVDVFVNQEPGLEACTYFTVKERVRIPYELLSDFRKLTAEVRKSTESHGT
jgi:hypothetical protein